MNLENKFDLAVDYLYANNNYLAAEVTKLGYPAVENSIPTAGVVWDKEKKRIGFLFNEKFAESLTLEEFAFVIAHESVHVINCHVFMMREEVDRMTRMKKNNAEVGKFRRKFNVAADCVVNDSLTILYGLPKVLANPTPDKPSIIYGMPTVKTNCHDMTVMEVFALLDDKGNGEQGDSDDHGTWSSFFESDGSVNREFVDSIKRFIEDKLENSQLSDKEAEKIDQMKEDLSNSSDQYARQAGVGAVGKSRAIDALSNQSLKWNKLLFQLVDSRKPEDRWNRANNKLISIYPEVILPFTQDKEKYEIFAAIDSSGSIDYGALSLFASVIKNTPRNFIVKAISFDDACYDYDIKGGSRPRGGGGTNFQIIENHLLKLKKYPKAVFVLTDGYGTHVSPKHPERWCWLLYGSASAQFCKGMKHYNIKDLLK